MRPHTHSVLNQTRNKNLNKTGNTYNVKSTRNRTTIVAAEQQ